MHSTKQTAGSEQRPVYETPTVISLSRVPRGEGQAPLQCSLVGHGATVDCGTGYSAGSTCAPLGLDAGGACTTGDTGTLTSP